MLTNSMDAVGGLTENNWVLATLALLPAVVLCVYIYRKDRVEKEPIGLLLMLLAFGALTIVPAIFLEQWISPLIDGVFSQFGERMVSGGVTYHLLNDFAYTAYCAVDATIGVALVEEGVKWIALVLLTRRSRHFNCLFDGIVYAVFVSLGFAALENVMYAFNYGFNTVLVRALTAIPGHMFNGVLMGFYYSFWKLSTLAYGIEQDFATCGTIRLYKPIRKNRYMVMSLAVPILTHGFYDFCIFTEEFFFEIVFYIFLFGLYMFCFKRIDEMSAFDGGLMNYARRTVMKKYDLAD